MRARILEGRARRFTPGTRSGVENAYSIPDHPMPHNRPPPMLGFLSLITASVAVIACRADDQAVPRSPLPGDEPVIAGAPDAARPPFKFTDSDATLLDEIQRGCFLFFWHEVSPKTGMVVDRTSVKFVSVAGVGFQ